MISRIIYPPFLPQMNDGHISIEDIQISGKIYVEINPYSNAQAGDAIRLTFGNIGVYFYLITNPLTDFPIIIDLDANIIPDGRYIVEYTSTDLAGNISQSPISWAIVDRYNEGILPPPIFTDANENNQITNEIINANNGTYVHIPAYSEIAIGEIVDVLYWTIDDNGNNVPGSQYSITHTIENNDLANGFDILVPIAYLNIVNMGTCQARYSVKRSENITENSKIGMAYLNLLPVAILPPPIFIDNIDGWLTSTEVANGIRVRGAYPNIAVNDNVELFIFGFDIKGQTVPETNLSQKLVINSANVSAGYFDVTFPKSIADKVGLGRFDSCYMVTNPQMTASSYFGTVNLDVINNTLLPAPIFTQAVNNILSLQDIEETNGAIIEVKYNAIAMNDHVIVHVSGKDEAGLPVQGANWQISHIVTSQDATGGLFQVKLPLENAISVGDNGHLLAYYSVIYNNAQGFDYSATTDVKFNMIKKPELEIALTTGAPPHDFQAIHVYPFNQGIVMGAPGASIVLSCSRPAEFDGSGSNDLRVTLNELGIARFKLRSPSSGAITVDGYVESNPSIKANTTTQFKAYNDKQGQFIAWASSTNASADEIMPCSIYLITEAESTLKRPITQVRITGSGSAKIVGYPSQSADILLNSDQSAEINIVNIVEENITASLTLPESSGNLITTNLFFKKLY